MQLPIVKDRRTNQILCLGFCAMSAVFLIIGGIYALRREPVLAQVMCFLAAVTGGFGLFYGVLWFIYGRKAKKRQRKIERAAQLLAPPTDNTVACQEFLLPRQKLTETARLRFRKIAEALAVTAIVVFVLLYTLLLILNGYSGPGHLALVAAFCLLMVLPGLAVQYVIYRKYEKCVPRRILLFPGKIIVDGQQFPVREIDKITISSILSANPSTSLLYRKLVIKTKLRSYEYTIDYRSTAESGPCWNGYGELLEALQNWAKQNRTKLTVDYMN